MSDGPRPTASPAEVASLLERVSGCASLPERLETLSEQLLGRPYVSFPLRGSADEPEEMVSRLDGFDCVTFAESVLALGGARAPGDFEPNLAALRYRDGRLGWSDRNHYMTEWIERNERAGLVERVLPERWVWADPPRVLSILKRYPERPWRPHWLPSSDLPILAAHARAGDLVGFVSNRPDLDTFHVGLLVPGKSLAVRHASRSAAMVIHQDLGEFLTKNDVPGMLVVRPRTSHRGESP